MEALINNKMNIVSSFNLSSDDVATISLLYSPLIGSEATNLYLTLQALMERNNLKSESYTHEEIFTLLSLTEKKFLKARFQLEGIGLFTTYIDDKEDYLYVLSAPLSPKNFIKDATLGLYLYSKVGKETFDKIYNHFKIEKLDKSKLTTCGFDLLPTWQDALIRYLRELNVNGKN